ncbi:glutaredoxin family protein [Halomonas sp. 18H]|uniref:glutaredoxin family protein n=1 Tax=Halomonas almeriensis TaxID=308163 RepID=UPI0022325CFA|nr:MULTISPECIES: glutaredoxin family protein [Halomonas]MCW4149121.1 glutaredoxin family protein [Halomonas sp. 18H]MDN3552328.1 glutaredoxin family protein [Halomonas almeriensis]
MIELTLYTTTGCYLCEALEAWLARLANAEIRLEQVDVAEDDALVASYGTRLPVLVDVSGHELEGGFEPARLAAWLADRGGLDVAAWDELMLSADNDAAPRPGAVMRSGRRYLGD